MIRVFAYLRVSTAQQLDGDGFDRQLAACQRFVDSKGWSIARSFKEQQSGADDTMDRPKLVEAMSLCGGEAGYDIIVVERVDRIARDLIVAELFFRECKEKGIKIYSADSGEELVNADGDPTRKLIRQILGALAEWEKTQLCRKLQAGRRRKKAETGRPCGGPEAYGRHEDPRVRAHQETIIEYILQKCYKKTWSFARMAEWLSKEGFPTPTGGAVWHRSTVHKIFMKNAPQMYQ